MKREERIMAVLVFILLIGSLYYIHYLTYDAGYKDGSTFLDCQTPRLIDKNMSIIFQDKDTSWITVSTRLEADPQDIKQINMSMQELCDRLKLTGFYKRIDSEEAYDLILKIFKADTNLSGVPEVIKNEFRKGMKEIESEENYLALFDDSRTKYLEASPSGGKK